MRASNPALALSVITAIAGALTGIAGGTAAAADTTTYSADNLPAGCTAETTTYTRKEYTGIGYVNSTGYRGRASCTGPLPGGHREYQVLLGCPAWWDRDAAGKWVTPGQDVSSAECGNHKKPDRLRIRTR